MTTPLEELRTLHAGGQLAARYPRVRSLLAEITDDPGRDEAGLLAELRRCGRVLDSLGPDEVLADHPTTGVVTVALTGHSTLAQLTDPLTAELARHGLLARLVHGTHGAYLRDLTDPGGELRAARPDLTLCVMDADAVFGRLPLPWGPDDAESACQELADRLTLVAEAHTAHGTGTLVLNTLPLPRHCAQQLVDQGRRARLGAVWREFNARLLRLAEAHPAVVVLDLDPVIASTGPATDPRLALYTRSPFTDELFSAYARDAAHVLRSRTGLAKKCLVLDLDNTRWGGILGEDGPEGIAAGGTLIGEPYAAVQRVAKQLAAQGVLLAVSSKNDPGPVADVLAGHPDMTLRPADFVAVHANWEPKDGNLDAIARRLGISPDALVFLDDSPAERALVRRHLPGTAVVPLGAEPALHLHALLRDGWFDTPQVTEDDTRRTVRYREAAAREEFRASSTSYEDYLAELRIEVSLSPPEPHEIRRLSQLSLRTNQFNLTGERVQADRVAALAAAEGHRVLAVRVADRFGDSGLVGALFTRRDGDTLAVDNVFLSCRALARGIEDACLAAVLAHAHAERLDAVRARYRPTRANAKVSGFYPSLGFTREPGTDDEGVWFRHTLAALPPVPGHLTLDARLGGTVHGHHLQHH
ncbi:HAD-IIIC family phosphatase [Streptomyces sp. NPDC059835]|uniref:HAD-IIIC family phosphatase n=1 Tax=Streptomyces sp. NPDC059835 TaxID=3346967 RepID=UPI00364F7E73